VGDVSPLARFGVTFGVYLAVRRLLKPRVRD
jgi:hypothetical protein